MIDKSLRTALLFLLLLAGTGLSQAQTCENRCLSFDGSDDAIKLLNSPITTQNAFTVEAWVFSSAGGVPAGTCDLNLKTLFYLGNSGSNKLELGECDGILHIDWAPSGPVEPIEVAPQNIRDSWHHIALVRENDTLSVFLDGEEVFSAMYTAASNYTALLVGHGGDPAVSTPGEDWEGKVDEVRVWNTAKDAQELEQYKRCALSGDLPADLLVYWPMDQGVPEGDNTSITELEDATGNGHEGELTSPPAENFLLSGPVSNFVCSDPPTGMEFLISQVFIPGMPLEGLCSGAPANFCVTEGGMAISGQGGFSVEWEYSDGAAWQSLSGAPAFSGFCFTVPPGNPNLSADCTTAPGSEEKQFRPVFTLTGSSGAVCTWTLPAQTIQLCCPVTEADLQLSTTPAGTGTFCEGEMLTLEASLTIDPFATPPAGEIEVRWTLNGDPLPDYDDMLSFAHEVAAGEEDICLEAVITHCSCPALTANACIEVSPQPVCGLIESRTDTLILVPDQTVADLYHICPGEDAVLGMADPAEFENCQAQWQYLFPSEGVWKDLGSTNVLQQTNVLPSATPEWPADEECIKYRVACLPLGAPSGCDTCYSNEITICLVKAPEPVTISGATPVCEGTFVTISVDNPDPAIAYHWFFNGMDLGFEGPEYESSEAGCYWAVASGGCASQAVETPKFCLEVCEIKPVISCPLSPNPCPNAGEAVTLSGCDSADNCSGILEFEWTDGDGNTLGTNCQLTHTPEPGGTEYFLTVTNPNTNCSATTSLLITPCMGN
jgi:hypothetical protein